VTKMVRACFASLEFAVTVLFGTILYLWCAVYFAVSIYLNEVRGLFVRAIATWRIRVRVKPAEELGRGKPIQRRDFQESAPQCGPVGRGRFESWLN